MTHDLRDKTEGLHILGLKKIKEREREREREIYRKYSKVLT